MSAAVIIIGPNTGCFSFFLLLLLFFFLLFKRFYLFIFREKGREGEREGAKHQLIASHTPPTQELSCNPGLCPDPESKLRPFGVQDTQPTEPHQSGLAVFL